LNGQLPGSGHEGDTSPQLLLGSIVLVVVLLLAGWLRR
jgi:hypothetical protein